MFNENSKLAAAQLKQFCVLTSSATKTLELAFSNMGMSARTYSKILKVARTIADLAGQDKIASEHVLESLQYRGSDSKYWGE